MSAAYRERENPSTVLVWTPGLVAIRVDGSWKPSVITVGDLDSDFVRIKDPEESTALLREAEMALSEAPDRSRNANQYASDCWSCPTHDAIREFSTVTYSALARKAVFQLQRMKASGVYGDDYRHKTLWDEYCHEVQEGPYDLFDDAWHRTLSPVLRAIIDAIPRHEAALLTIGAIWDLDEEYESSPGVNPHLMQQNLQQVLSRMAGARDMSRFDPTLER